MVMRGGTRSVAVDSQQTKLVNCPVLNSTARIASRLETVQQEQFPTALVGALAASRMPSLVNFSRQDRKYPVLPALDSTPDGGRTVLKAIPKQIDEQWRRGLALQPDIRCQKLFSVFSTPPCVLICALHCWYCCAVLSSPSSASWSLRRRLAQQKTCVRAQPR
jgi:hypothetical protein